MANPFFHLQPWTFFSLLRKRSDLRSRVGELLLNLQSQMIKYERTLFKPAL